MAGITRFFESKSLLDLLAKHNIPAHTQVIYPDLFYKENIERVNYHIWERLTLNDWNEYIRLRLVSTHGQWMLQQWWERLGKSS
ncbi:hypothetical protein LC593_29035 [Nostoc sp. CHAB 5844]|nr:hypothetical protein [Nostoc sp. CHAB 5844]